MKKILVIIVILVALLTISLMFLNLSNEEQKKESINIELITSADMATDMVQIIADAKNPNIGIMPYKTKSQGLLWIATVDIDRYLYEKFGDTMVSFDYDNRVIMQKSNGKVILIDNNQKPLNSAIISAITNDEEININLDEESAISLAKIVFKYHYNIRDYNGINLQAKLNDNFWTIIAEDLVEQKNYKLMINKNNAQIQLE